ncbi:daptide-type RiPP biosynthesis aminotransferase [Arthrobacter sp. RAF14]|uniref:daptide-type RiPP biosynthesis aminotransferase n=1 Tax=Arthrobacter sp. RAF14 TaxID=3233051 RepID=UPI003F92B28D
MTDTFASDLGHSVDRQDVWPFLLPSASKIDDRRTALSSSGVTVRYKDGTQRLCAASGLWNAPLGFGNAFITESIERALREASYLTLFRSVHQPAEDAASVLLDRAGRGRYGKVIFSTSGGAANDAVMKLVRQYWHAKGAPERQLVIGLHGSYHGTMYGSQSLSGDDLLQSVYAVDRRTIRHVAHDDGGTQLEALVRREGRRVGAVVLEPVLGSGAHALPAEFLAKVQELRDEVGFLLVADEVATGFWRTGPMFASEVWEKAPDALIASKALTNGTLPAAAILVGHQIVQQMKAANATFVHGETQAGTPVTCAAIIATLHEMDRIQVSSLVERLSLELSDGLENLMRRSNVTAVSGRGLFRGIHLRHLNGDVLSGAEVMDVVGSIFDHGVIVHPGPSSIQLLPAYIYGSSGIREMLARIDGGLAAYFNGQGR